MLELAGIEPPQNFSLHKSLNISVVNSTVLYVWLLTVKFIFYNSNNLKKQLINIYMIHVLWESILIKLYQSWNTCIVTCTMNYLFNPYMAKKPNFFQRTLFLGFSNHPSSANGLFIGFV